MNFTKCRAIGPLISLILLSACGSGDNNSSEDVSSSSPSSNSSQSVSSVAESSSSTSHSATVDSVVLFAVNAGGTGFTSTEGIAFSGDHYFSGGNQSNTSDYIQGTQDQELYNTERWGEFSYGFPVKSGSYDVIMYFAETWFGPSQSGNRVFDVAIEGATYIQSFDPLASVGHDVAHSLEFSDISVTDGMLSLDFIPSVDQASLRGIVILGQEGNALELEPGFTGTLGDGPVPGDCPQGATLSGNDFVLFDGGDKIGPVSGGTIELHQSWLLNEVWALPDGARLDILDKPDGKSIQYFNADIYTGFKLTPPLSFGERQSFRLSGVDLYIQGTYDAQFGLRVIKPGENEGNGGASTTTWMRNSQGAQNLSLDPSCQLLSLSMPSDWDVNNQDANRFILEVKGGWNVAKQLQIRRMVIKGFSYAD